MYIYSEFHLIIYLHPVGPKLPIAIHTRLLDCSVIKIMILHVAAYIGWCTVQLDRTIPMGTGDTDAGQLSLKNNPHITATVQQGKTAFMS